MRNPIAKVILAVIFVGLIATPLILRRWSTAKESTASTGNQGALARYGFQFAEVSSASGINFTHQAPALDTKLEHIMPQIASMGAAVSIVDFDRDACDRAPIIGSSRSSECN